MKRDATAPVVTLTGNAGTYTVADQVAIHCSASDALSGHRGELVPGHRVLPAYSFGHGTTTVSASATDQAGNMTQTSTASS